MTALVRHWLYPINPKSHYVLVDPDTGEETVVSTDNLLAQVEKYPDREDRFVLNNGYRLMRRDDAVWIYVAGAQEVRALARVRDVYEDEDGYWYAMLGWDLPATRELMDAPVSRAELGGQLVRGVVPANTHATGVLQRWLAERGGGVTTGDGPEEPASEADARSRTLAAIVRRQGQPAFRARLLDAYERRCAVTREPAEEVLEAAHISPYLGPQTNTTSNGLLLRADLHTLFDRHLISVDDVGRLVVSERLAGSSYEALAGSELFQPSRTRDRPRAVNLAKHRKELVGRPLAPGRRTRTCVR